MQGLGEGSQGPGHEAQANGLGCRQVAHLCSQYSQIFRRCLAFPGCWQHFLGCLSPPQCPRFGGRKPDFCPLPTSAPSASLAVSVSLRVLCYMMFSPSNSLARQQVSLHSCMSPRPPFSTSPNSAIPGGPCPLFWLPVPLPPGTASEDHAEPDGCPFSSRPQSRGKEAPPISLGNPGSLTASAFTFGARSWVMMCPAGWQLGLILCLRLCRTPRWCL